MQKGDEVYIRLKEKGLNTKDGANYVNSAPTNPTFPFNMVAVLEADFFNDYVKGYVPPVIVKDWTTGEQKEIVFELNKSKNSSLKVNGTSTTLDSHGFFNLTGTNILPSQLSSCQLKFDVVTNNRGTKVYAGDAAFTVSGYTQAATICYIIDPKTGLPVLKAFGLED